MKRLDVLALVALPVAVDILLSLDALLEDVLRTVGETFQYARLFWTSPLVNVLYAVVLVGMFWLVHETRTRWIGAVYLVAGIGLLAYPSLRMFVFSGLPLAIRDLLPFGTALLDPARGASLSGAFVAATGASALLRGLPWRSLIEF
jgi:hypothetical protein